jgi:hypothetical protein
VAIEFQGQCGARIHCHAGFMAMPGAPRILLQMNSIFRVRFAWYLVAAVVAGLLALPASAALLVGLRHLRAQYLASDLFES